VVEVVELHVDLQMLLQEKQIQVVVEDLLQLEVVVVQQEVVELY
tara:strand:- start:57 stop:188 length:132 start_codon:yes stop_codon:yes gene_type:complete